MKYSVNPSKQNLTLSWVTYLARGHANPMMKPKTVFHFPDSISMVHTAATVYTAMADTPAMSCDYFDISIWCE